MSYGSDPDLEVKVKKATERISENMHIVANEPSLAFYRLQEHVRKALNPMVDRKVDVLKVHQELQGRCYDMEYAVSAIKGMDKAESSFKSIQDNLKNSIFLKQQLKYEESRKRKPDGNSVYKRLSAHITIDLPELPELSDVVRETANRVESIMKSTHSASRLHHVTKIRRSCSLDSPLPNTSPHTNPPIKIQGPGSLLPPTTTNTMTADTSTQLRRSSSPEEVFLQWRTKRRQNKPS